MNQCNGIDDQDHLWVSAERAAELLGVKRETLYAYASRGKVRTRAAGGRRGAYLRSDIERLQARRDARSGHGAVAAGALRWGEPVLDSSLTEIRADGHRYRGRSAIEVARAGFSFEEVTEHLWGTSQLGDVPAERCETGPAAWRPTPSHVAAGKLAALLPHHARPIDAIAVALPAMAVVDPMRLHAGRDVTVVLGRRVLRLMVGCIGLRVGANVAKRALREPTVARSLLMAAGARYGLAAAAALDLALVLCADHELNPSSFAARVAASAGADLYACIEAALATLSGPKHGGMPERVEALLDEIARPERAARIIGERLRRGDALPGFGHPLYPDGDPRTAPLLDAARALAPRNRNVRIIDALVDAMRLAGAPPPTLDVGLVALASALHLGPGGAVVTFAVGRTAGWVAHVMEQRDAGFVLRPRARYVGP